VKTVVIRDQLSDIELSAGPGDEVRWINKGRTPVSIILLDQDAVSFSCKQNFGSWLGAGTARLAPHETASLCFEHPGKVRYALRLDTIPPLSEIHQAGTIQVADLYGDVKQEVNDPR